MLNILDDTPIVPGDAHPAFDGGEAARQVLGDAEDELRQWQPNLEPIHSTAGALSVGAMPGGVGGYSAEEKTARSRSGSGERRAVSEGSLGSHNGGEVQSPYAMTEAERREIEHAGMF